MPAFKKGDYIRVLAQYNWPGLFQVISSERGGTFVEPVGNARRPAANVFRTDCLELATVSWHEFKSYLDTGSGNEKALIEFCTGLRA